MNKKFLVIFALFCFVIWPDFSFAKTDLSIADTDITLSKDNLLAGQTVRIYARIFNNGDIDVYGFVMFYANKKEISQPQPISVRSNNYDDVFVDWTPVAGTYDIEAKIINTNPQDENLANNIVYKKNIIVEADSNKNGIPDNKEQVSLKAQSTSSASSQNSDAKNAQQESGSNIINNIEKTIQGVLGASNESSDSEANKNWIMNLQNYLNTASQNVKTSNKNYGDYLIWILLAIYLILLFLFKRKK